MLHKLVKNEQGNVLVMVAVAMTVLLLMTALVVDVGNLFYQRTRLQNVADAAALAAAIEGVLKEDVNDDELKDTALIYIGKNGFTAGNLDDDRSLFDPEDKVTVVLTASEPLFFGPLIRVDYWNFSRQASAKWIYEEGVYLVE